MRFLKLWLPWLRLLRLRSPGFGLALLAVVIACDANDGASTTTTPTVYQYRVVAEYPHSDRVFTQGLEFYQNKLLESGGQYGRSSILVRTLEDDEPERQRSLPTRVFAEGLTVLGDTLYLLTWREGQVLIFDPATLAPRGSFGIEGEGWGLTNDGHQLIMSSGSSRLTFRQPDTLAVTRQLTVTENGKELRQLNELEWVEGLIYANIWKSERIVMIDPQTGIVVGSANLQGLLPAGLQGGHTDVLNGIAYDATRKRLWVTGKYWPRLFEIKLTPVPESAAR